MQQIRLIFMVGILAVALTAIGGAGTASANGLLIEGSEATVTGSMTKSATWIAGGEQECSGGKLSATVKAPGKASLSTSFANMSCSAGTWETKGCNMVLRPGAETSPGRFSGYVDIGPSGCGPMRVPYFGCGTINMNAQTGIPAAYENIGSGATSEVVVTLSDVSLKHQSCGGKDSSLFSAQWKIKGESGGKQKGVSVGPVRTGLYVIGTEQAEEAIQPQFSTENGTYPVTASGSTLMVLETEFGEVECTLGASGELTATTKTLPLSPTLSGCAALGFNATSAVNSCQLGLNVLNVGPPYKGTLDVICSKAGDAIEIKALGGLCTVKVPAQTGLGSVSLSNTGSSYEHSVKVNLNLTGVSYTGTSGFCVGSSSSGNILSETLTLKAFA